MPHCPECLQEQVAELARCPLDRAFYVERTCQGCGLELRVREKFCPACGAPVEAATESVVADLPRASLLRRGVAFGVDMLVLFIILMAFNPTFHQATLVLGPLCWLGYLMGFSSSGRQTLGQSLMGLTVLTEDRHLASPSQALRRGLTQIFWWGLVVPVLAGDKADFPRRWSGTDEFLASAGS